MAFLMCMVITAALVGVDQLTKYYAVLFLKEQPPLAIWPNVLEFKYYENDGIAFSMFEGLQWIIVPITIIVMMFVLVMLWRGELRQHILFRISCVLILAGGIGNLIDRTVFGYVVDFIYVRLINFPVFNFADCCVVIGAMVMMVFLLFFYKDDDKVPLRTLLFGLGKGE